MSDKPSKFNKSSSKEYEEFFKDIENKKLLNEAISISNKIYYYTKEFKIEKNNIILKSMQEKALKLIKQLK